MEVAVVAVSLVMKVGAWVGVGVWVRDTEVVRFGVVVLDVD